MKNTVILTSKQNFVWHSMQEIIPFIVDSCKAAEDQNHVVRIVDVDELSLQQFLPDLIQAHQVILSCFTPKIFKLAAFLRHEMSSPARFIIHLHNQATIACWPMRFWGGKELFRKKDIFISSCERDAACLKVTYPDAECAVVPFSLKQYLENADAIPPSAESEYPLIFIGRISSQKNLHTLLLSLSLLPPELRQKTTLTFVGKEDNLGSPNMGFTDTGYLNSLKELTTRLGLSHNVHFAGFQDRAWIQKTLDSKRWIFASPSLHSDENFGMVAFQCLGQNHLTVLSDWGGHADYRTSFPDQTFFAKVYRTHAGPYISPQELADAVFQACAAYKSPPLRKSSQSYTFKSLVEMNRSILNSPPGTDHALDASETANILLERAIKHGTATNPKIFDSYEDPLKDPYFESYGMSEDLAATPVDETFTIVPWAQVIQNRYHIDDPHRGHFQCPFPTSSLEAKIWMLDRGWAYRK